MATSRTSKVSAATKASSGAVDHIALRSRFSELLLANPNHFGTIPESSSAAALALSANTNYEHISCVGLNPQLDQLEAVVRITEHGGYGGTLCNGGSSEHVRFYVSYDGGVSWTDLGLESFTVYDTPGKRPLDYAVNRPVPMRHRWCFLQNEPIVRAILAWNQVPTANNPAFTPVWGNVVDVRVQPTGSTRLVLKDLLETIETPLHPTLVSLIDADQPLQLRPPVSLTLTELAAQYAHADVEPHRFGFAHVQQALLAAKLPSSTFCDSDEFITNEIDIAAIVAALAKADGNTSYEELGCIGYDAGEDALVGVLTVKKPNGYSGGPCTAGSTEYVGFWVDWGSGAGFQYVGTSGVRVHDVSVPTGGLRYAVYQPIPTTAHRRDCIDGPVQPTIRAILSWEVAPPPGNPNYVPTWGNRQQTTIQLAPGAVVGLRPVVDAISGVPVCDIDQSDGRTIGADQPFGGMVTITGFIPGAPDRALPPMKYRVRVRDIDAGGSFKALTNDMPLTVTEQVGSGLPVQYGILQSTDADDFYTYLEDTNPAGSGWRRVVGNVLAQWSTGAPMTGRWEIEVVAKDPLGGLHSAQTIMCSDGTTRAEVTVRLDEIAPTSTFVITEFIRHGTVFPAQECMKFKVDDILRGTYSVVDQHFRVLSITLEPSGPAAGAATTTSGPNSFPSAPTAGTSGTWELHTGMMAPCGYVLTLRAWDRTIVSGSSIGWEALPRTIGFSLES
jgi:hypothetical protein